MGNARGVIRARRQLGRDTVTSPDAIPGRDPGVPASTQVDRPNRRRKTIKTVAIGVYPFYLAGLFWLGEQLYWNLAFPVPLTGASREERVWTLYYPEMAYMAMDHARHAAAPDRFEVVLLGGSVLKQVAPYLQRALGERLGSGVKVHCLAAAAHTSRDSYIKYGMLHNKFDLLIVYNGINDVRMNCVDRSRFRDDYSHCNWYRTLEDRLARGAPSPFRIGWERAVQGISRGMPDEQELALGAEVKTERAFTHNIESIVADAGRKGTPVVLMSFAYYLPANYSRDRFEEGTLDYGHSPIKLPAEEWGIPANLAKAMDIHNRAIAKIANTNKNSVYIDQNALLPKSGRIFSDPCHLTEAGCIEFARNVARALPADRFGRSLVDRTSAVR